MTDCSTCGAKADSLHHAWCKEKPQRVIKVIEDPRTGRPIVVDPVVQAVRNHTKKLMESPNAE